MNVNKKMILRSRKIPARPPKEPQTPVNKSCASPRTPLSAGPGPRAVQMKSPSVFFGTIRDGTVMPRSKTYALRQTQQHCRLSQGDQDMESPLRERSVRVHFQIDEPLPKDPTLVDTIYNHPVLCFLNSKVGLSDCCCPTACKETCRTPGLDPPYFSDIPMDITEELNTCQFVCSVPQSCNQWQSRKEIPFKTRSAPENTLVLDFEDLLIYSSLLPQSDADFSFLIPFQDTYYKVYLKLRPHAREFLETLCKVYEIFIFTTAKREYSEKILEILDPHKKLIRHRLFQDHCICVDGHYVKDLTILQRDLAKTVALDTVPFTFPYQITNRIPVQLWTGNRKDRLLLRLISILQEMTHVEDIRLVTHQININGILEEA